VDQRCDESARSARRRAVAARDRPARDGGELRALDRDLRGGRGARAMLARGYPGTQAI